MAAKGEVRDPSSHRTPSQIRKMNAGYDATPAHVKKRVERDQARRLLMKEGLVAKYDGKDVNHIKPVRSEAAPTPAQILTSKGPSTRTVAGSEGKKR